MRFASLSIIAAAAGISIYVVATQPCSDGPAAGRVLVAQAESPSPRAAQPEESQASPLPSERVSFAPVTVIGSAPHRARAHR